MAFSGDLTGMDLFDDFNDDDFATKTSRDEPPPPAKQARRTKSPSSSVRRRATRSQVRTRRQEAELISFDDDDNDTSTPAPTRTSSSGSSAAAATALILDDDVFVSSAANTTTSLAPSSSSSLPTKSATSKIVEAQASKNIDSSVAVKMRDDDDDDDDEFPAMVAIKAGESLPSNDARVRAAVAGNRGPLAGALRIDGLVRLVDDEDAVALALRRRDLERVRGERAALLSDVHRAGGLALIDWSASIEDAMIAAHDRRLAEVLAEHSLDLSLPPEIVSARDAKYRTAALRVVDDERRRERERAANAIVDAERRSVRDALQGALEARGDENEEEVALDDARVVERMRDFRPTDADIKDELERSGVTGALDAARTELSTSLPFGTLVPVTLDELRYYFDEALDRALRDPTHALTLDALRASSDWAAREIVAQPVAVMIEDRRSLGGDEARVERAWIDQWRARYDAIEGGDDALPRPQLAPRERLDRLEQSIVELVSGVSVRVGALRRPSPSSTARRIEQSTLTFDELQGRIRGAVRRFVDERQRARSAGQGARGEEQWRAAIGANEFVDEMRRARRFVESLRVRMHAAGLVGALERELAALDRELDAVARTRAVERVEQRVLGASSAAPVDFVAAVALRDDGVDASVLDGYRFRFEWQVRRAVAGHDKQYTTVRVRDASVRVADRLRVAAPFAALDAGRYRVIVTAIPPSADTAETTLVSAEATVVVMARCARDCAWYDAARPPPFGACQWRTRPLDASRKRVRDSLADEAAIAFGVRALDASSNGDDSAVLAIATEGPLRVRAHLFSYEAALRRIADSFTRVAARRSPSFARALAPTPFDAILLATGARTLEASDDTRRRIIDELDESARTLSASAANAYERQQIERIRSVVADGRRRMSTQFNSSNDASKINSTNGAMTIEALPVVPVVRALRDEQLIVIELDRDRRFVRALADRLDTLESMYIERAARVDRERLERMAPDIDADATLERERERARRHFASLGASSLRSLPSDVWQLVARSAATPPRAHPSLLAASSSPSTSGAVRDDFFADVESEREFWRRRDDASARARSLSTACQTLAPLDVALAASSASLSLHTVVDSIDWRGEHSVSSTQPDVYRVEFAFVTDDRGERRGACAITRGSARVDAGYDFDELHAAIEQACAAYMEIRDSDLGAAAMRARRRARVERLVRAYNVVAQFAPPQPPSAPVIGAVDIERFFVERERDAVGRPVEASDISGATTTNLGGIALVSASGP